MATVKDVLNGLNPNDLMEVVKTVKENWEAGKTVWKAKAKWENGFAVETASRQFCMKVDEPNMLCGSDTAANPVEIVVQAYGACLAIGFVMNATVRGIKVDSLEIDVEGEIDLPGFLGLEPPAELGMDSLPGYKNVKANLKVKADADEATLQDLLKAVVSTSPVGVTLSRPVKLETTLEAV